MKECIECKSTNKVEEHHILPRSIGGTATVPLCVVCHGIVHDRDFVKSRNLQAIGIAKAKAAGKYIGGTGRKKGSTESLEDYIQKQRVKDICQYRQEGILSYREIASVVGCSVNSVQKCYRIVSDAICKRIVEEQTQCVVKLTKEEAQIIRLERKLNKLKYNK